ncbi:MAG: adenylate kinase [Christensenellales bacterium]|jgi:adenylate kinase
MNLIFLGPPGAGKGTQASSVSKKYFIPHISTGEILRSEIDSGSELGKDAKGLVEEGLLVPDELMVRLVNKRVKQKDCQNGFLLDGYPRTLEQAKNLNAVVDIDLVVSIEVAHDKLIDRLTGRRVCSNCKAVYHANALKSDICIKCGEELAQREDDKVETVQRRLEVYTQQTLPVLAYYEAMGKLRTVQGDQAVEALFSDICKVLEKYRRYDYSKISC